MESFQWNERKGWQTSHLHHVEGMQGQDRGQNNKYNWVSTSVPTEPSFLQMYFFLGVIHFRTEGEGVKKWPLFWTTVLIGSARIEVFLCQDPLTLLIVVILEGDQVTQSALARWSTTNAPADAKSSIVQTRTHCCGCTYRQTYSTVLRTFVRWCRQGGRRLCKMSLNWRAYGVPVPVPAQGLVTYLPQHYISYISYISQKSKKCKKCNAQSCSCGK